MTTSLLPLMTLILLGCTAAGEEACASKGFTSTALTPVTSNAIAELSEAEASRQRYAFLKKKKQKARAQRRGGRGVTTTRPRRVHAATR